MCTGLEIAALAASAAGSAASSYAQNQQLKQQDSATAAGLIQQGQLRKQGSMQAADTVNKIAASNADTQATSAKQLAAYRSTLQSGAQNSAGASPAVPGASKAFQAAQTGATNNASGYVDSMAQDAATTEGTGLERVGEGETLADSAGKIGQLNAQSAQQADLTKLKVAGIQANPWITGLGMLLKGAGAGMGAAAGYGAAGAASGGTGAGAAGSALDASQAGMTAPIGGYLSQSALGASTGASSLWGNAGPMALNAMGGRNQPGAGL